MSFGKENEKNFGVAELLHRFIILTRLEEIAYHIIWKEGYNYTVFVRCGKEIMIYRINAASPSARDKKEALRIYKNNCIDAFVKSTTFPAKTSE